MSRERVRAWKPRVPGVAEVFHADFVEHVYPPHTHDTWTLFVVDHGAIRYDLDRHHLGAGRSTIGLLPPHVVHDGRPATTRGYRKRVVYLDTSALGEDLIGPAVDMPSLEGGRLRRGVDALHERLGHPDRALEAETLLGFVVERLREHLTGRPQERHRLGTNELAERLRDLLDAHAFETVTLAAAAERLAASPAHLVRCFTRTFGIAPHAYVLSKRIEAARLRLLEGEPVARVAASVGFFDQAHLTRHFKRHVGTTPGRYAAQAVDA
jgi:AraC-like DNA-binding protein